MGCVPPEPLGVGFVGRRVAPCRDGVGAPVNEDAEFGIGEPLRGLMAREVGFGGCPGCKAEVDVGQSTCGANALVFDVHVDIACSRAGYSNGDGLLVSWTQSFDMAWLNRFYATPSYGNAQPIPMNAR